MSERLDALLKRFLLAKRPKSASRKPRLRKHHDTLWECTGPANPMYLFGEKRDIRRYGVDPASAYKQWAWAARW